MDPMKEMTEEERTSFMNRMMEKDLGSGSGEGETPPQDPPREGPPKEKVKVVVDGQVLEMTEEQALRFEENRRKTAEQAWEKRLEGMRPVEPKDEPKAPGPSDDEWLLNPKAATEKMLAEEREKWKKEAEERENALRDEYKRNQSANQWWSDFFAKYPHLKASKSYVELVMAQNYSTLQSMESASAIDWLAEEVSKQILQMAKGVGFKEDSVTPRTVTVRGKGGERAPKKEEPKDEEGPKSLSAALRAKQRRRSRTAS